MSHLSDSGWSDDQKSSCEDLPAISHLSDSGWSQHRKSSCEDFRAMSHLSDSCWIWSRNSSFEDCSGKVTPSRLSLNSLSNVRLWRPSGRWRPWRDGKAVNCVTPFQWMLRFKGFEALQEAPCSHATALPHKSRPGLLFLLLQSLAPAAFGAASIPSLVPAHLPLILTVFLSQACDQVEMSPFSGPSSGLPSQVWTFPLSKAQLLHHTFSEHQDQWHNFHGHDHYVADNPSELTSAARRVCQDVSERSPSKKNKALLSHTKK